MTSGRNGRTRSRGLAAAAQQGARSSSTSTERPREGVPGTLVSIGGVPVRAHPSVAAVAATTWPLASSCREHRVEWPDVVSTRSATFSSRGSQWSTGVRLGPSGFDIGIRRSWTHSRRSRWRPCVRGAADHPLDGLGFVLPEPARWLRRHGPSVIRHRRRRSRRMSVRMVAGCCRGSTGSARDLGGPPTMLNAGTQIRASQDGRAIGSVRRLWLEINLSSVRKHVRHPGLKDDRRHSYARRH